MSSTPEQRISRSDLWRQEYQARPYLEHLGEEDLNRRLDDVVANSLRTGPDGRIQLTPASEGGEVWLRLFAHAHVEMARRGVAPNHRSVETHLLKWVDSISAEVVGRFSPQPDRYLVKYGEERFIRPMLEKGSIRLNPATVYGDPSLNPARKDDELRLERIFLPSETTVTIGGKPAQVVGNITIRDEARTNFYVFCTAAALDARMFGQFGYNACLLIRRPEVFTQRVLEATRRVLPGWKGWFDRVTYVDPFSPPKQRLSIGVCKHFRYSYQKEVRGLWAPPAPQWELEPVDLEVGSLEDICEVIVLPREWRPPGEDAHG